MELYFTFRFWAELLAIPVVILAMVIAYMVQRKQLKELERRREEFKKRRKEFERSKNVYFKLSGQPAGGGPTLLWETKK